MKNYPKKTFLIMTGAWLYNWIWRKEKGVVNSARYDFYLPGVLCFFYPNARHSSTMRWLLAGHLLCLALVTVIRSTYSNPQFSKRQPGQVIFAEPSLQFFRFLIL